MTELHRAAMITLLLVSAGCSPTPGDGSTDTVMRAISEPFDGVRVSDGLAVQIILSPDNVGAVEVTSDANLVPIIETVVVDGVLDISADNIEPTVTTMVVVNMATLASASAADEGASIMVADIDRTGAGELGTLTVNLSEGATGDFSGSVTRLIAIVSGQSYLRAFTLVGQDGELDLLEESTAEVHLTSSVIARASGASTIRLMGSPGEVEERLSGDSALTME